jgi:hypothetical protein
MAVERGYDARIAPEAGAALPEASPDTFGAGVGRALEQVGGIVHETRLRTYALDRKETAERESADFAHRFATTRQDMDSASLTLRSHANPGGAGHAENMQMLLDAQREKVLGGITEDSVRRQATAQFEQYSAQVLDQENTWEHGQAGLKKVGDFKAAGEVGANRIYQTADPKVYAEEVQQRYAEIDALDIPPDQKDALRREAVDQKYAIALNQGFQNTNPRLGLAMLDAGTFAKQLTQPQTDALRSGYQVEIRRQEAAAAQAVAHENAELQKQQAAINERARQGDDVTADAAALAPKLAAAGDEAGALQMRGHVEESGFAKAYNGMTPLQLQGQEAAIEKILPDKRTDPQRRALKWIQDHKGALTQQFNSDPVAWAIANAPANAKPPALDGTPAGLAARVEWWITAQRTYGPTINLFSENEARAYREQLGANDAGYHAVADELAALPTRAAQRAAAQIAPNDVVLGQMVQLPPDYRKALADGRAYRKDPGSAKALELANDREKARVAALTFGLRNALGTVPATEQNAVLDMARDLFADEVRRGKPPTSTLWAESQSRALGGVGTGASQKGGLGSWNDKSFLVPDGMTAQNFTDRVFGFIAKHPEKGPLNADGSPASIHNARPIPVGKDTYEFHIGNTAVMGRGKDGKITSAWRFKILRPPQ